MSRGSAPYNMSRRAWSMDSSASRRPCFACSTKWTFVRWVACSKMRDSSSEGLMLIREGRLLVAGTLLGIFSSGGCWRGESRAAACALGGANEGDTARVDGAEGAGAGGGLLWLPVLPITPISWRVGGLPTIQD